MESKYKNIALVGDTVGIPLLLECIPLQRVGCIIAASIRPQYIDFLSRLAKEISKPLLIQPRFNIPEYSEFLGVFTQLKLDSLICNSYSMILRRDMLEEIGYNAINIHAALLPKNRGPNSIQWAIIKGEEKTGVTMHYMDDGIDTGDIIAQREVPIAFEDTWVKVSQKVAQQTKLLLEQQIHKVLGGTHNRVKQDENQATTNHRLDPDSPKIDFDKMDDLQIYNLIRAQVSPLKGAYVLCDRQRIAFDKFVPFEEIPAIRRKYANKM